MQNPYLPAKGCGSAVTTAGAPPDKRAASFEPVKKSRDHASARGLRRRDEDDARVYRSKPSKARGEEGRLPWIMGASSAAEWTLLVIGVTS